MNIVQGPGSTSTIPEEPTPLLTVPYLTLPALNLATNNPLEEFFNFSFGDFMQLLRRYINMILSGDNLLEVGCPMLNDYLDNIKSIGVVNEQPLTELI